MWSEYFEQRKNIADAISLGSAILALCGTCDTISLYFKGNFRKPKS